MVYGDTPTRSQFVAVPVKSPPPPLVVDWEPDWLGKKKKEKKNMLTLSTDLEHRGISDMAAVLWQATEAAAPVRSSGQMAVANVEAPSGDSLPQCTKSFVEGLCQSSRFSSRVAKAFYH